MKLFAATIAVLLAALSPFIPSAAGATAEVAHASLPPEQLAFFETNIRPMLVEHCYKCHSAGAEKLKAGLYLDTKAGTLQGGESGHAGIIPGQPERSSIYEAITWANEDVQMPPKKKLPDSVIADFKKWIEMGAPDPRESTATTAKRSSLDVNEGRKFWAFQKPVKATPPAVTGDWARTDVDRFLQAGMVEKGLRPAPDADKRALIRRAAFDLTGLPPTPEEVTAFLADTSPLAFERVIDQYLESPRFGERWGRHWLDVTRYGESSGKEINMLYPHAWRYRDYVIDAFNQDKPYDRFLKEQIAGDLMPYDNKKQQGDQIVATGFLAIGTKSHNERSRRDFIMNVVDEQIDALSQGMLGLTIACARCHDHKFDPVPQRDYYALAGIFLSSETLYGTRRQLQNNHPSTLIELGPDAGQPPALAKISPTEVAELKRRASAADKIAEEQMTALTKQARNNQGGATSQNQVDFLRARVSRDEAEAADADADLFDDRGNPRTLVMGMLDRERPIDSPLLIRGEADQPGEVVPRGLVEVLCAKDEPRKISEGSGRLDLAWFIASKDNPLTARVMVNRIWLKLFGKGIVATPDNFGKMGSPPTHPALLDYLAVSFMENGWSVKKVIRSLMLSRAYQMSAAHLASNYAIDPDNQFLWRMNQRRLDAEALRDAMLAITGTIDYYPPDGSPVARAGEGREGIINLLRETTAKPYPYRSVYLPIVRDQTPEMLNLFDFADPSLVSGDRDATNVPSQGLFMLNNQAMTSASDAFAMRIARHPGDANDKMKLAFELVFCRPPTSAEVEATRSFFARFNPKNDNQRSSGARTRQTDHQKSQLAALSAFCQALFASAEFRYLN